MTQAAPSIEYAGLWRRFVAFLIDVALVGMAVSTLVLLSALAFPKLQSLLTLDSPFALLAVERTLDGKVIDGTADDARAVEKTVDRTVWGRWTYRYRVTEKATGAPDLRGPVQEDAEWQQIDPATGQAIDAVSVTDLVWLALFFLLAADGVQPAGGIVWQVGRCDQGNKH